MMASVYYHMFQLSIYLSYKLENIFYIFLPITVLLCCSAAVVWVLNCQLDSDNKYKYSNIVDRQQNTDCNILCYQNSVVPSQSSDYCLFLHLSCSYSLSAIKGTNQIQYFTQKIIRGCSNMAGEVHLQHCECQYCKEWDAILEQPAVLKSHVVRAHQCQYCKECGAILEQPAVLKCHVVRAHQCQYCNECDAILEQPAVLKCHVVRAHQTLKVFSALRLHAGHTSRGLVPSRRPVRCKTG